MNTSNQSPMQAFLANVLFSEAQEVTIQDDSHRGHSSRSDEASPKPSKEPTVSRWTPCENLPSQAVPSSLPPSPPVRRASLSSRWGDDVSANRERSLTPPRRQLDQQQGNMSQTMMLRITPAPMFKKVTSLDIALAA